MVIENTDGRTQLTQSESELKRGVQIQGRVASYATSSGKGRQGPWTRHAYEIESIIDGKLRLHKYSHFDGVGFPILKTGDEYEITFDESLNDRGGAPFRNIEWAKPVSGTGHAAYDEQGAPTNPSAIEREPPSEPRPATSEAESPMDRGQRLTRESIESENHIKNDHIARSVALKEAREFVAMTNGMEATSNDVIEISLAFYAWLRDPYSSAAEEDQG